MPNVTEIVFVVGPLTSAPPWHREMEPHSGMGLGAARDPGCSQIHPRRLRMMNFKGGHAVCRDPGAQAAAPCGQRELCPVAGHPPGRCRTSFLALPPHPRAWVS